MTGLAGLEEALGEIETLAWDFFPDPDAAIADVAAAVTAWLAERLGSEEVREAVSKYLLTEAMDGDFLVAAGRSIDNEGQDVPINKARTSEVAWWAADAALAAVVGALAGES